MRIDHKRLIRIPSLCIVALVGCTTQGAVGTSGDSSASDIDAQDGWRAADSLPGDQPGDPADTPDGDAIQGDPTGSLGCAAVTSQQGWSLCTDNGTVCEIVFEDSSGCPAVCATLGLTCQQSHENLDGQCAADTGLPTLECASTGHISDFCVCAQGSDDGGPPADDGGSTGGDPAGPGDSNGGGDEQAGGDTGPMLAFPTARGAGAYATGGRGGQVIRVTNLDDSGSGSLRAALTTSGPRIITFAVSGTIIINSSITVTEGDFTIAGQTAPQGGVTITGGNRVLLFSGADNFVVRYVRVRPEYSTFDAVGLINCSNHIFDHVSASFGGDEVITTRGDTDDVTFQRLLIAEGKTGSLFGDSNDPSLSSNLSFHHNAFYNISHRHPNIHVWGRADHYNNVVFNWKYRWSVIIGNMQLNHIANYYSQGCIGSVTGGNSLNKIFYDAGFAPEIYSAGNLVMPTHLTDAGADNWGLWNWRVDVTSGPYAGALANTQLTADYQVSTPFPLLGPPTAPQTAQQTFTDVTADVGANKRIDENGAVHAEQDALDALYLADILAGDCVTYQSSSSGQDYDTTAHYAAFRATLSTTPIATGYADSNGDGIPDAWKTARGFGVSDDLSAHVWPSGYVGIEEFLNEVDE